MGIRRMETGVGGGCPPRRTANGPTSSNPPLQTHGDSPVMPNAVFSREFARSANSSAATHSWAALSIPDGVVLQAKAIRRVHEKLVALKGPLSLSDVSHV